jgi:hypothetical protein
MKYVHDEGVMQEERSDVADGMVPVRWPVSYASLGSRHFLSKGTILDVTTSGLHVTGTVPVEVGMRLHLWGGPPAKPAPFDLRATVVWVKGHEFGLDLHSLGVEDQQWLTRFLAEAHSQSLLSQAA